MGNRILNSLNDLDNSIKELKKDFVEQLKGLENDTNNFHKHLIDLISKYPESKEILEFVVLVNDKLETKLDNYFEIVNYTIMDSLKIKSNIISFLKSVELEELNKINNLETSFIDKVNEKKIDNNQNTSFFAKIKRIDIHAIVTDIKSIIIGLLLLFIVILFIINPKKGEEVWNVTKKEFLGTEGKIIKVLKENNNSISKGE
jgi:hypothetical protein